MKRMFLKKWSGLDRNAAAGWLLLAAAAVIGLWTIRWGFNDSEADALVTGYWMTQGDVLYKDIFSHHFPLYYWWSALSITLFGKSIWIARAGIWAFQVAVFGLAMAQSRYYLPIGITALIWSVLRHFYQNQFLIYFSFSTVSILAIAAILLFIEQHREKAGLGHCISIAALSAACLLADPLSVYAVGLMLLFLWVLSPAHGLRTSLVLGGLLALFVIYLLITGTLNDFYAEAIVFNQTIYASYNPGAAAGKFSAMLKQLLSGLEIGRNEWLDLDPMRPISTAFTELDRWFFTGFLYRLAVLISAVVLIAQRKYAAGLFIYALAAAALSIGIWGHRSSIFVLLAVFLAVGLITQAWWPSERTRKHNAVRLFVSILISVMLSWTVLRTTTYTYKEMDRQVYHQEFDFYIKESLEYKYLTCGQEDVKLGYYPSFVYPYFFTDLRAVSGYYYMWPWVAEIGMEDVLEELEQADTLAILNRRINGFVWNNYHTRDYLQPLDNLLRDTYYEARKGIFISPALAQKCQESGIITIPSSLEVEP